MTFSTTPKPLKAYNYVPPPFLTKVICQISDLHISVGIDAQENPLNIAVQGMIHSSYESVIRDKGIYKQGRVIEIVILRMDEYQAHMPLPLEAINFVKAFNLDQYKLLKPFWFWLELPEQYLKKNK